MRIWDQFAFTPTGQPVAAASPPALRVLGGDATAQQLLHARAAFYKFRMHARLSSVPNPTEQGFLPDGSRYTIVVVGPQTTMTLWVSEADSLRNSGISFVLSRLNGQPLPEHSKEDGTPITYLLTPREKKGTRISSGKWAIRKPKFVMGGKAVSTDKSGLVYYTGVKGAPDLLVPFYRGQGFGVNGQAYLYEEYQAGEPLFCKSEKVGESAAGDAPIPFIYRKSVSENLAMQLRVVHEFEPTSVRFIELLVGKFGEETNAPVGPVVSRENLPSDLSINYQGITFSADGRIARAFGSQGGTRDALIEIDISPSGTNTRVVATFPSAGNLSGVGYYTSSKTETSGVIGEPGYTAEHWEIFGSRPDGYVEYGTTYQVTPETGLGDSGTATLVKILPASRSFDRRGRPMETLSSRRVTRYDRFSERYRKTVVISWPSSTTPLIYTDETRSKYRKKEVLATSAGSIVMHDEQDELHMFAVMNSSEYTAAYSGGGRLYKSTGSGFITLYEDDELDFSAVYEVINSISYSWTYVTDSSGVSFDMIGSEEQRLSTKRLLVHCKGRTLVSEGIPTESNNLHVVFLATDPLTGAMVINLQEVNQFTRATVKSWIFVVDDTGARFLHEVMKNVSAGTDIKVMSNAVLISV